MTDRRRRIMRWMAVVGAIVLLLGGVVWRVATSKNEIDSVPLSTSQFNVRFLKADLGKLSYSSDDMLRAFLRKRLPNALVRKLGDVTTVTGFTGGRPEHGEPPLVVLFQLLTPQNTLQNNTSTVFGKIEFPESSGFVHIHDVNSWSSWGQGTSLHQFPSFPRREPMLHFRLTEKNGKFLMEKSIPNPGYRSDFPVWKPEPLPATKQVEGVRVALKSLKADSKHRTMSAAIDVESDDPSWLKPEQSYEWSDATGNSGRWLSPFEPAWKLHLRLHRRHDAEFPARATWKLEGLQTPAANGSLGIQFLSTKLTQFGWPELLAGYELRDFGRSDAATNGNAVELKTVPVEQERIVDGIGIKVRYVAPASKMREENGTVTLLPPSHPGSTGMSTSAGSTMSGNKLVRYVELDVGMPHIRLDHDPLPPGVDLVCDIRDEHGVLLNNNLSPGRGGANGVNFCLVYYAGRAETKTLSLEVRVSRPRDFEFVVAPPEELRKAIQGRATEP